MKRTFVPMLICLLLAGTSAAQESKIVPSKITEANLFFNGAELVHTANGTLARGENTLTLEGLSPIIDVNSLKIKTSNNVIVSSYEFSIDYLSTAKAAAPGLQKLRDSIVYYQAELEKANIAYGINRNMLDYLKSGTEKNVSGSEQGLGIDELMKTMEYYKTKALELETEQARIDKRKTEYNTSISRLQAQLNQESVKGSKTSGVLKLTLSAPTAGNASFTVSYFTSAAAWSPYYDINITSTDKPILFALKSKVRQTTGLDWDKVKLTLSTATPSNGKIAPLFNAWFLEQIRYNPVTRGSSTSQRLMQNSYAYADVAEESIISSLEVRKEGAHISGGSSTGNGLPLYIVNGTPMNDINGIDPEMIKEISVLNDASATSVYGARGANGVVVVTLKSGMDDFVTSNENELNRVYNIDLPYSIPGNGKTQNIDLQNREAPAEYKYYCAPKLDTETYLLAEISDWQNLGLLSAPAHVTYDGTYIGETPIDASSTQPKLTLTLGTDKRIAVKREKLQDFSSTKTFGSNTEQTFTYLITVKNNQNKTVKMVTKDQYPLSTDKSIVVTLHAKETTAWTANVEELGVITWEEELAPGETKTYRISYTIKYPKDINLNL